MFKLKQYITLNNNIDKKINDDIFIKNGIVYIDNGEHKYKYEHDCYFVDADGKWVNLQGGVPVYETNELLDEDLFEPMEAEVL